VPSRKEQSVKELRGKVFRMRQVPPALRQGLVNCSASWRRLLQALDLTRLRWHRQPGYNQAGVTSLTDEIGTLGCEASPNHYGYGLNRQTGFESVLVAPNRRIRLSRPTLRHREVVGV
jgi:hypothetical protein